ncbi:MAG: hypothetical protein ACRC2V_04960 [Xenococcaceae cyanobacterium]
MSTVFILVEGTPPVTGGVPLLEISRDARLASDRTLLKENRYRFQMSSISAIANS